MIRRYVVSERECDQSIKRRFARCTVSIDAAPVPLLRCLSFSLLVEALGLRSPHVPIGVPDHRFVDSFAASPSSPVLVN